MQLHVSTRSSGYDLAATCYHRQTVQSCIPYNSMAYFPKHVVVMRYCVEKFVPDEYLTVSVFVVWKPEVANAA